jgi:hypothetical protein
MAAARPGLVEGLRQTALACGFDSTMASDMVTVGRSGRRYTSRVDAGFRIDEEPLDIPGRAQSVLLAT